MKKAGFVAVPYDGISVDEVLKKLEQKVPLFVCTEKQTAPIGYLAGFLPVDTYRALFKSEPGKGAVLKIPPFLEEQV